MPRATKERWIKTPEMRTFSVIFILLSGMYLVAYPNSSEEMKIAETFAFIGTILVILLGSLYGIYVNDKAQDEEDNFIKAVIHQMQTPLTALRWTLDELANEKIDLNKQEELLQMSGSAARKISKIMEAFSFGMKNGKDKLAYQLEEVGVADFIEEIVKEFEPTAKQFGVKLNFDKPMEEYEAMLDKHKMEMAISNIIHNGVRYNKKSGAVNIRIKRPIHSKNVEIIIEDTGLGMSPLEQKKVFTKFYRTRAAKKTNPDGSGIGAYITRQIIEKHKGKISLESVLGQGTVFHIFIPIKT